MEVVAGAADAARNDVDRGGRSSNNRGGRGGGRGDRGGYSAPVKFVGAATDIGIFDTDTSGDGVDLFNQTHKSIKAKICSINKKFTLELSVGIDDLVLVMPDMVPDPPDDASNVRMQLWKEARKDYVERTQVYEDFSAALYNLVIGQCSRTLEDKLRASPGFVGTLHNGILLLVLIRTLMSRFETANTDTTFGCIELLQTFTSLRIGPHEPLSRFHDKFVAKSTVLKDLDINIVPRATLVEAVGVDGDPDHPTDAQSVAAMQKTLATYFLIGVSGRYKKYMTELKNAMLEGRNNYPVTLTAAYHILQERPQENVPPAVRAHGAAFVNAGGGVPAPVPGDNGVLHAHITCHNCQRMGHYSNHCPDAATEGNVGYVFCDVGFVFTQAKRFSISKSWILMDNQASEDIFCNADLLVDIHTVDRLMCIHCNAGVQWTNQQGVLPGYGLVWYCPKAIANILSFANVASRYWVDYDQNGDRFVVTKADGKERVFGKSSIGLYFYDTAMVENSAVLVNMVEDNKTRYTNAEVTRATIARNLQTTVGRPSTRSLINIVNNNQLRDCPVTKRDIVAAEDIFGTELGSLQGKTTRRAPLQVDTDVKYTTLPRKVHERYREVTIAADIMHVNGIMFFVSISRHIKLGIIEVLENKNMATVLKSIKSMAAIYHSGGFRIRHVLTDGAFESLKEALMSVLKARLNTTSRDEHVGEIERYIRTVKERMRSTFNALPFKRFPARMVIESAKREVFWLNAFPNTNGISKTLSPRTIITGDTLSYTRHCKFDFGEYVQTHEQHGNDMSTRTVGALALRPTGNMQGGFYFFSLSSGQVINRNVATKLPMPNEVVDRVHQLARQQKANMAGLVFGDRAGNVYADNEVEDGDDDDDYDPDSDDDGDDVDDDFDADDDEIDDNEDGDEAANGAVLPALFPRDNDHDSDNDDGDDNRSEGETSGEVSADPDPESEESADSELEHGSEPESDEGGIELETEDNVLIGGVEDVVDGDEDDGEAVIPGLLAREGGDSDDEGDDDLSARMDAEYGARSGRHNLRPRKRVTHSHLHANAVGEGNAKVSVGKTGVGTDHHVEAHKDELKVTATPQMSMAAGLRLFGVDGELAVTKEMRQLHDRMVMKVQDAKELTPKQREDALAYLMFLKRKRSGKIKGRGCADGRKQREWTDKADSSSPTIATAAVFLTIVIDALEGRDVAVVDIPGAFMQADMDELVHVRFTGLMVDKLLEIDYEMYAPYIVYEGKVKCLYVELLKALYGTLRAARLFWEKLSSKLKEWGFITNPYDSCVVNKMINGKQCTIGWHVDDLKISHVDSAVVDHVIDLLDGEFGEEEPLSKSRGKVHDYLGMILDFSVDGAVTVDMTDYVRTVIADMPKDMEGTNATPAASNLFAVNQDPVLLSREKADVFHRMVMQLLYLCQRGRPDLQTAISFLCRRTSAPDEDDYKKLTRVMRYLQGTLDLKLTLSGDGSDLIRWWVDASYGVHADMKSHTGATLSMGKGSIHSMSSAQKIVGCSSTEAELIGVHDIMPQIIWTANFLKAQGIKGADTVLYQDNKSTILLANNGRASVGKRSRHINIRYFFVKDRIANGELRIEYCPTLEMWGDFFTKSLQGVLFYKFRDLIMNIDPSSPYHSSHRSVLKNEESVPEDPEKCVRRSYRDVLIQ